MLGAGGGRVCNGAVRQSWVRMRTGDIVSSRTVPHRPPSSSVVLCRPPSSSVVPRDSRRSYVVTCRPLAEVVSGRGARRPC